MGKYDNLTAKEYKQLTKRLFKSGSSARYDSCHIPNPSNYNNGLSAARDSNGKGSGNMQGIIPLTKDSCPYRILHDTEQHTCHFTESPYYLKPCETDNAFPDECEFKEAPINMKFTGL